MAFDDRDIHVVQGHAAGLSLRRCFHLPAERLYVHVDVLSVGPLTSVEQTDLWQDLRRDHWQLKQGEEPDWLYHRLSEEKHELQSAPRIYLWLGMELAETILVGWLIAVFKHLGVDTGRFLLPDLDLPPFRSDRGGSAPSVAILNFENLRKIGSWHPLDDVGLETFEAAWRAVSDPTPSALIAFCAADPTCPDRVRQALRAFMSRYPSVDDGLGYWDRVLLENCRVAGHSVPRIIGHTLGHDPPYPDHPGDRWLFRCLKRMGDQACARPLVRLSGDLPDMRHTTVELTKTGERVLAGRDNFIALNGIEDWVGGVRLSSRDRTLWLHDGETLVPGDPESGRPEA